MPQPTAAQAYEPERRQDTLGALFAFFLPLGLASCLLTITHVIINATLSKAADPELAIASYAIAFSLFLFTERPAVLIRHTSSALAKDRLSFRAVQGVAFIVLASILLVGLTISYTPLGALIFQTFYGVDPALVPKVVDTYQFLIWVSVFSGLRCLYQGVIISQLRTKWMTLGMIIRLIGMFALSYWLVQTGRVDGGAAGALVFAVGMFIEMAIGLVEGKQLLRGMPEQAESHNIARKRQVFGFYRPLLASSFIAVTIPSVANAMLGKTYDLEISIASFAVATSLYNFVMSFFVYIHQIVLNFHLRAPELVRRFQLCISIVPVFLMVLLSWTPFGSAAVGSALGLSGQLLAETMDVLRLYTGLAVILPWLEYGNGFLMLNRRTNVFLWSQSANAAVAVTLLVAMAFVVPDWNGRIGAVGITAGFAAELAVVWLANRKLERPPLSAG